jgi:hypothetical protein
MSPHQLLTTTAFALLSAIAQASDWQYAGQTSARGTKLQQFFDAETVSKPDRHIRRVWIKSIETHHFDRHSKAQREFLVEKTARKLATGYVPEFLKLESIKAKYEAAFLKEALVELTMYEIIANMPSVRMFGTMHFQIECDKQLIKHLGGTLYKKDGEILAANSNSSKEEYQFIEPDSNGQWWAQILCAK